MTILQTFTTDTLLIAGTYPQTLIESLAGLSEGDATAERLKYRDRIDYVHDRAEASIINDRAAWKRFVAASAPSEVRSLVDDRVTAQIRVIGLAAITADTQRNLTDKVLESVWDTWKSDEAEQS